MRYDHVEIKRCTNQERVTFVSHVRMLKEARNNRRVHSAQSTGISRYFNVIQRPFRVNTPQVVEVEHRTIDESSNLTASVRLAVANTRTYCHVALC